MVKYVVSILVDSVQEAHSLATKIGPTAQIYEAGSKVPGGEPARPPGTPRHRWTQSKEPGVSVCPRCGMTRQAIHAGILRFVKRDGEIINRPPFRGQTPVCDRELELEYVDVPGTSKPKATRSGVNFKSVQTETHVKKTTRRR